MTNISDLIKQEIARQEGTISLIASENITSQAVLEALGSVFTNKYAEGYPGKRYYGGCEVADQVENRALELAKGLFSAEYANVQPYSGTPANMAVYLALLQPGDTILSMDLPSGGHLSHGHKLSFAGHFYNVINYGVNPETGLIDYDEVERLAKEYKPKMIIAGASAYPRIIDWQRFRKIADEVGAIAHADISHIAGLIVGGAHPNPTPIFDTVVTTTHKTLRGPRAGMILAKAKYGEAIDKSVFPLIQGGPHLNNIAGVAVALEEASQPAFKDYIAQVVANAKALAEALIAHGFQLVSGGTDNHLVLVDLTNKNVSGKEAENKLAEIGIIVNKNMIPNDPRKPLDPSGIRLGTPLVTSRGMKESEMQIIADIISEALLGGDIEKLKNQVKELTEKFRF